MRIQSILTAATVAAALLVSIGMAQAQTLSVTLQPNVASGASGTYHADVTEVTPTSFTVDAFGNNDGVAGKHNADQISYTFVGDTIATDAGSTSAAWTGTGIGGDTAHFNSPGTSADLLAKGGNTFNGTVTLSSPIPLPGQINFAIQDGGQQWFASAVLTPESTSLALMLPALLPLLFFLRQRKVTAGARLA